MNSIDLGLKEYEEVWQLQKELVAQRIENKIPDTLVLVEHPHVITKGRRSKALDVVNPKVPVFEIERGGEVTYHGPGQLVGYPIIYLGQKAGIKDYMRSLEEVLIRTLEHFDIQGVRKEGCTGVWVQDKKIASLGVAVKKWVTYHGFALNVNTDLSYFQMINPCGFDCSVMTSMQTLRHQSFSMDEVKAEVIKKFQKLTLHSSSGIIKV
ncbi:MAG: lipoyl(octanoyl) transferase LipB [Deltaproteobacteria bacterium]|nr:lipoyl(octanoyl) transferase LipB [Deltaproteobacteria bacterium]MBI3017464.1 lipoyl(octanoyl) transferase LipB [Deltaproteobacteria bacterium]